MILVISAVFPPEPVVSASISYDLAVTLSDDWEVRVLSPRPTRPKGFSFIGSQINHEKYEHVVLDSYTYPDSKIIGRMLESYSFGKHAVNHIKNNKFKIQCIYLNAWPLLAEYCIVRIAKKYSIPIVIHVQDIYPESLSNKLKVFSNIIKTILFPIDKYILKNASSIVAISDNMLKTLIETRRISSNKIIIVQNWQNEDDFNNYLNQETAIEENKIKDKPFIFMYLGNIGPVAGVELLMDSFAKAKIKEAILIIAGSGSQKNKCVEQAKLYQNVTIEFWDVPFGKVPEIQKKANVLLLPAIKGAALSSIPSKLSAYMFSEKPIIACVDQESDTAYAIKEANCGWIVPPENSDILSKTMIDIISISQADLYKYGKNGYNYAMENYSKKKNLNKLRKIIIDSIKK